MDLKIKYNNNNNKPLGFYPGQGVLQGCGRPRSVSSFDKPFNKHRDFGAKIVFLLLHYTFSSFDKR